jgi:Phage phiEco32-like COOH.NH2 ligase-type 2
MNILIGCDPEVFVKKGGTFLSAHGLIKGDKKNPFKVNKGAVQVDGMALEFNIDPAHSEDEFCINVQEVYNTLKKMVPGYEVVAEPVAHFTVEYMQQQPMEALELGCDPDYNGWTGAPNEKPDGFRPFRTASGHIHVGWGNGFNPDDFEHQGKCNAVARQLDFYLGLPSLFYDEDVQRREMYGKGGCLRYKPYGMEYRTLSNAWLNSKKRMAWVYNNAIIGVNALLEEGKALYEKYGDIQDIINNSDKKAAKKIIKAEGILCVN